MSAAALVLAAPAAGHAQPDPVGQARQVVRSVFGVVQAERRPVVVDGDVFWQEVIETGEESASKIEFVDATTLATGPNSRVRIDEFVYAGGTGAGRVVIEISRGVLRFVSGLQPSASYSVRTPNAMIGVRGTDFVVSVDAAQQTTVSVRRGSVSLAGAAGGVIGIGAGYSGSIAPDGRPASGGERPTDRKEAAPAAQITALLAIAGQADPAAATETADVAALSGRKGQAALARAATVASPTGAGCGGC